jgi:hypothetical protein
MNRKLYGIFLAAVFLALSFLMGCGGSSSSTTTTPPPPPPATSAFAFYLSGQEAINEGPNYYALAGAVTITAAGTVTAGEQDYNDGFGITSPEPSGDTITGGTLTVDATTGQGTLTLNTNNTAVGASGTETLGVQFVNADHALITQFDGSATSSGSMDFQTLGGTPSGGFAFTLSGVDLSYGPVAIGGVFTIPSAATDEVDVNDDGDTTTTVAAPLTVSLGTPDAFGRGVLTSSLVYGSTGILLNYYVVGPEVIRIIDVDPSVSTGPSDSAVGSAFGQGTNATGATNASLTASVFAVSADPFGDEYGVAGQITPNSTPTPATYSGIAEDVELDTNFVSGLAGVVGGTYTIAANGYGSMTIAGFGGGNVHNLQVYATDPTLDLSDPNNANGNPDVGGALLLEFESGGPLAGGTGVAIPQTDPTSTDFNGTYAAGWQNFNDFETGCGDCEFDMVAQGTMASGGVLSLTGEVSDPFQTLGVGATTETGATFTSTPLPDSINAGRFSMLSTNSPANPLAATIGGLSGAFDAIIYQASASQLFWLEYDDNSVFVGPIEEQGTLTGVPAVARPGKAQAKQK